MCEFLRHIYIYICVCVCVLGICESFIVLIFQGVFVILVQKNTPAALAGLRFGDQILMINDVVVAGFSMDEVHKLLKKANPNRITMVIRDR